MGVMDFDEFKPEDQNLKTIVGSAVGRASMCWERMEGTGIFQSDDASSIVDEVVAWIEQRYELKEKKPTQPEFQEVQRSPIMRYFEFEHLPEKLREVSISFSNIAWEMEGTLPSGPEKSTALRKLLEAKDAAVRAALDT